MKKKRFLQLTVLMLLTFAILACSALVAGATNEAVVEEVADANNSLHKTDTSEEQNIFSAMYDYAIEYAGEIMCALAFVGSAVIALLYKKGLMPMVKNGLTVIGGAVGSVKSTVEKGEGEAKAQTQRLTQMLEMTGETVELFKDGLDRIEARLDALSTDAQEKRQLRVILEGQTELLYDVFMSSSLPQYKKDEIGERVKKMREIIAESDAK